MYSFLLPEDSETPDSHYVLWPEVNPAVSDVPTLLEENHRLVFKLSMISKADPSGRAD
jgi:hypothetical protein